MSIDKQITKRDGSTERAQITKIQTHLYTLCTDIEHIDIDILTSQISSRIYSGMSTDLIDNIACEVCARASYNHPNYMTLAGRVAVSQLHRITKSSFSGVMSDLYNIIDPHTNMRASLIADDAFNVIKKNADVLDGAIDYNRDYDIDYFGLETLKKSYLMKIGERVVERPQHLFMRVVVGIHGDDLEAVLEAYEMLSKKWFIPGSPVLCSSGSSQPYLASCYVLPLRSGSIAGVLDTVKQCALISERGGGIGLSVHCARSACSDILGFTGMSWGLTPMLQIFNGMTRYVDFGGRRRGALAAYIEPWHSDIFEFLSLRTSYGDESKKARDILCGLWIPDLFMKRVKNNEDWTLMDPVKCPGLDDCWGERFNELYRSYEMNRLGTQTVKAVSLWKRILNSQIESGTPFVLFKDTCNRQSNQQHLGTIKSSSLCTEILQFCSLNEISSCCIASISLPKFVDIENQSFDFNKLIEITQILTKNLNRAIDSSKYPTKEAENYSKSHRPIGIGVQGLADVFALMRYPFESKNAARLNKQIFETIYFAALKQSCDLAKKFGRYQSFEGSLVSQGILQPDLCGAEYSDDLSWGQLRDDIKQYGTQNSLVVALMPTTNTSKIFGNTKSFEPFHSNIFSRKVNDNDFVVFNRHLVSDLIKLHLWSNEMTKEILANRGSIQHISNIPNDIKDLYKTVWEIPQTVLIQMAVDRAPFIDQSQSMSLYMIAPDYKNLNLLHFLSWRKGLKTGMYRLRKPADAVNNAYIHT